jgi:hypothetical protein
MARKNTGSTQKTSSTFTTIDAAQRLMASMEVAINNMIEEIKKPVDQELNGAGRKAELSSIKQTALDCKELVVERQRLEQMIKDLSTSGQLSAENDYSGGFAERYSK